MSEKGFDSDAMLGFSTSDAPSFDGPRAFLQAPGLFFNCRASPELFPGLFPELFPGLFSTPALFQPPGFFNVRQSRAPAGRRLGRSLGGHRTSHLTVKPPAGMTHIRISKLSATELPCILC